MEPRFATPRRPKYRPRMRVLWRDHRLVWHRGVVVAADFDSCRVRLDDGRVILLDDERGIGNLARANGALRL